MIVPLAAAAAAPYVRSRQPGKKPGEFSRVFSAIGTYIGLRVRERYPTLIRKYEPKPIRIFYRMAVTILIFMQAIGGKQMKPWSVH
jgi:hypothetical protein